jgi:hypothetical protein
MRRQWRSLDCEGFKLHCRDREMVYHIAVLQSPIGNGEMRAGVDDIE